jgi:hypothetical protein
MNFQPYIIILLIIGASIKGFSGEICNKPEESNGAKQDTRIYSPFHIHTDPMEGLLLVNIENHPDSVYVGFEPQIFNDNINGSGMLIIAWRTDGYVDVYHQPTLNLNPAKYDIAGKGLAHMIERPLDGAYFRVEEKGVQAWFEMQDLYGRTIEVRIAENHPSKRKPFGLLAPMGSAAENPSAMPLILLHDFYFVRKNHTEFLISIAGKLHTPDVLPIPMDRRRMTFARYCPDPLIATLNPAHNGILEPYSEGTTQPWFTNGNTHLKIENHTGRNCIKSIVKNHEEHTLEISFNPPIPNITELEPGELVMGRFSIEGDRSTGKIKGRYLIVEENGKIRAELNPSGGWKPRPNKMSLRFLYTVAGVFKKWPKTYYWSAEITLDESKNPFMQSSWERR